MLQVTFGSMVLYDVYVWFTFVDHITQPSISSGCNYRNHTKPLAGQDVPRRMITLSERFAPRRYQRRTAPRLLGAEPQVRSGRCNQPHNYKYSF